MNYLVGGKPVDGVPSRDLRRLRLSRERPELEATLISTDEAQRRFAKTLRILYGCLSVVVGLAPIGLLALDLNDWQIMAPIVLAIWAFFAWFMPFMYRRKVRQFNARVSGTTLPAAPGSKVRADPAGLSIDGKSWNWSRLSLEAVGLQNVSTGGENSTTYIQLQSLDLAAGTEHLRLDSLTLSTGWLVLDQIYRRLKPAD